MVETELLVDQGGVGAASAAGFDEAAAVFVGWDKVRLAVGHGNPLRDQGSGISEQGSGLRAQGSGLRAQRSILWWKRKRPLRERPFSRFFFLFLEYQVMRRTAPTLWGLAGR